MERLTMESAKGGVALTFDLDVTCEKSEIMKILKLAQRLKYYEDLEEQGLLIRLPAKVGDTVYAYCSEFGVLPYEVDCIVIDEKIIFQCSSYSEPIGDYPSECLDEIEPDISDFGKTVFLTKAEAEEALQRNNGYKNGGKKNGQTDT